MFKFFKRVFKEAWEQTKIDSAEYDRKHDVDEQNKSLKSKLSKAQDFIKKNAELGDMAARRILKEIGE